MLFYLILLTLLGGFSIVITKQFFPLLYQKKIIRYGLIVCLSLGMIAPILMLLSIDVRWTFIKLSAIGGFFLLCFFTLYLTVISIHQLIKRLKNQANAPLPIVPNPSIKGASIQEAEGKSTVDLTKRKLLIGASASLPLAMLSGGLYGYSSSDNIPDIKWIEIPNSKLPEALDGFRILQISDLHLGRIRSTGDFNQILNKARSEDPELILITGDFCDHNPLIDEACKLIINHFPDTPKYACMGNHEYFGGIEHFVEIYQENSIPLLINQGETIKIRDTDVFIGGVDDPRSLLIENPNFFQNSIERTLAYKSSPVFTILMSHRPDAFIHSPDYQIDLMLAGHTHGTQLGLFGRSLFEPLMQNHYLWGHYQQEDYHLYTTSGMGHWFPFRFGCPTEIPIIVLRKGTAPSQSRFS